MREIRYADLPRRRALALLAALGALGAAGRTLRVGPGRPVQTLAEAARIAVDGQTVEVEAGEYLADVAVWRQQDLTLRAVGGRVRVVAAGASAQRKAIFVTLGERVRIEGFDFIGCRVPDGNGAGIRLERGSLSLFDCGFHDNEMGVLTGNEAQSRLVVEDCDFGPVLNFRGFTHNLYVGRIAEFRASGCHFHHGQVGHLLKSRAALNQVVYNRLGDEAGAASYELEFPDGGRCLVVGNLILQGPATQNPVIVSYGAEGRPWPRNELLMAHNTLIDHLPQGGRYLRVAGGPARVRLLNNLFAGRQELAADRDWELGGNHVVDEAAAFVQPAQGDWRLRRDSPLRGQAVPIADEALRPTRQYRPPRGSTALAGPARDPGAFQAA